MLCVYLLVFMPLLTSFFFFFNDTATTEIYTLSLHDALPIFTSAESGAMAMGLERFVNHTLVGGHGTGSSGPKVGDRKSTRLNSSHLVISYAVFCLKKKKKKDILECARRSHFIANSWWYITSL